MAIINDKRNQMMMIIFGIIDKYIYSNKYILLYIRMNLIDKNEIIINYYFTETILHIIDDKTKCISRNNRIMYSLYLIKFFFIYKHEYYRFS